MEPEPMSPLDVAMLVIKASQAVLDIEESVLREAMRLNPDLPWQIAVTGLAGDDPDRYSRAVQVEKEVRLRFVEASPGDAHDL